MFSFLSFLCRDWLFSLFILFCFSFYRYRSNAIYGFSLWRSHSNKKLVFAVWNFQNFISVTLTVRKPKFYSVYVNSYRAHISGEYFLFFCNQVVFVFSLWRTFEFFYHFKHLNTLIYFQVNCVVTGEKLLDLREICTQ